MDSKLPKDYVAELLKQLEELKKKKAHKERKLQKLKSCSLKDLKKEKIKSSSHASDKKERSHASKNEVLHLSLQKDAFKNTFFEKENSNSCTNSKQPKLNDINDEKINIHENCNSFISGNSKDGKDVENCSEMKDPTCNNIAIPNRDCIKNVTHSCCQMYDSTKDSMIKSSIKVFDNLSPVKDDFNISKMNNEVILSKNHETTLCNSKINIEVEKSHLVQKLKTEEIAILDKKEIGDRDYIAKETNNNETLPTNGKLFSDPTPDVIDDCIKNNSPEGENKLSGGSSKTLSSKNKTSDILDDSLNSNMSFFMSADLFAANDVDKKKQIPDFNKNICSSIKNMECQQQMEKKSKLVDINPELSSVYPHSSINKCQPVVFSQFNFPKFSTPTEGNTCQFVNDSVSELPEKCLVSKISIVAKNITFSEKTDISNQSPEIALPTKDKIKSPVNFALEKRLSSVLDAHYESPMKFASKIKNSQIISGDRDIYVQDITGKNGVKKRKLFSECDSDDAIKLELEKHEKFLSTNSNIKSVDVLCKSFNELTEPDQEMIFSDFSNGNGSNSKPDSLKNDSDNKVILEKNSCDDIPFQVNSTVNGLIAKVCEDASTSKPLNTSEKSFSESENFDDKINEDIKTDSEILIVPETEGLGLYFAKDSEDFLETSTLSESLGAFPIKDVLNYSSQSKLESPVVNNIVAAVKSSKASQNIQIIYGDDKENVFSDVPEEDKVNRKSAIDATSAFDNSLGLDTSYLEDDTQDLGNFKQMPYMNEINVHEKVTADETETESNLNFTCTLSGTVNQAVMDTEIILFSNVKYAIIQQKTYIYIWRQEKKKQWIKIFSHEIEDMFSLVKTCVTMDDDNLVIVMLLSNYEKYCLQFLIFEKDARVIKLMENTHWLEERYSEDSILLCGLSGLMFAIAQNKTSSEVSIHAFISLKESPRLMSAVLGCTETPLCSLCKVDKLPNALMGFSDSMLYVWHILEARLVTAVQLHPHDYIPIKECFWATVENGLVYFLTTCEGKVDDQICQLLAANLATGLCQSAMTYFTKPSNNTVGRIIKAAYLEPFLVVAHSNGAFIWSVMEEFCCAALPSKSSVTTIAISRDFENWGLLAVGSKLGHINCYSLN